MACARPSAHLSLLRPSWFSRELARFIRLRAAAGDGHDNSDASALVPGAGGALASRAHAERPVDNRSLGKVEVGEK